MVQVSALLPNYTSAPNTLIIPKATTALGYTAEPVGWLVQANQPITAVQIADARQRAAAAGITIETRTAPRSVYAITHRSPACSSHLVCWP